MKVGYRGATKLRMIDIVRLQEGIEGEGVVRELIRQTCNLYFQGDIIFKYKERWFVGEVKHQAVFDPPPFKGHGLPHWQLRHRLQFQKDTGIRALLFIMDKNTKVIYWQYMDILNDGKYHQTHGDKPRRVFPVESFEILNVSLYG